MASPLFEYSQQQLADLVNSARANYGMNGPAYIDTSYQFGDFLSGRGAAKQQAANQAQLDWAEYNRNLVSAREQREWEEMMDNTQFQRRAADIKAAGYNPLIAFMGSGFSGSVPSGAYASSSSGQAASANGSSALGIAALFAGIAKIIKAIK